MPIPWQWSKSISKPKNKQDLAAFLCESLKINLLAHLGPLQWVMKMWDQTLTLLILHSMIFLKTPCAQNYVPNWEMKLQQVRNHFELDNDLYDPLTGDREEWMILSDFHNSNINFSSDIPQHDSVD